MARPLNLLCQVRPVLASVKRPEREDSLVLQVPRARTAAYSLSPEAEAALYSWIPEKVGWQAPATPHNHCNKGSSSRNTCCRD